MHIITDFLQYRDLQETDGSAENHEATVPVGIPGVHTTANTGLGELWTNCTFPGAVYSSAFLVERSTILCWEFVLVGPTVR
jgi:hypothetical protein